MVTASGDPQSTVTAIIPALDEASAISGVLAELVVAAVDQVIVVDGGSTDETARLAHAAGATVIEERQHGYGRACAAGARAATGDVLVFLDGDGSDDPAFVPALLEPILAGRAVLTLGVRCRRERGALLAHQVIGNQIVGMLVWLLYGVRVRDVPPLRAVRRDVLRELDMQEMSYGWPTEMIVKAIRAGLPIEQVDVRTRLRRGGRSKIAGRLGPSLAAGVHMIAVVLRHA